MFEIPGILRVKAESGGRMAFGLKMGRPENRRMRREGDRRELVEHPQLIGPDAHGVSWWPIRAYYDEDKDETLIVIEPVHPSQITERLHDSA